MSDPNVCRNSICAHVAAERWNRSCPFLSSTTGATLLRNSNGSSRVSDIAASCWNRSSNRSNLECSSSNAGLPICMLLFCNGVVYVDANVFMNLVNASDRISPVPLRRSSTSRSTGSRANGTIRRSSFSNLRSIVSAFDTIALLGDRNAVCNRSRITGSYFACIRFTGFFRSAV